MSISKNNVIQWEEPVSGTLEAGNRVDIDIVRSRADGSSLYSIDKNVAVGKTNKVWYAAHNDKGKLDEGGANYAVMVKDSAPKSSEVDKLYALIRSYPGVTRGGMHSRSFVEISQTVSGGVGIQVRYNLNFANDPITLRPYAGLTGGMHVHTGRTCAIASEVGSHYFKDGAKDPWANVRWTLT